MHEVGALPGAPGEAAVQDRSGGPVQVTPPADATTMVRGRLFTKYLALLVSIVSVPLLAIEAFGIWSSYQDHKLSLIRLQREQAEAAAGKIGQFIKEVESQIGFMSQL